jgi:hypothetical protein
MPRSSMSSKHADDKNSTRGYLPPKPSQTREVAFRLQRRLLLCYQPDNGTENDCHFAEALDQICTVDVPVPLIPTCAYSSSRSSL